MSVIIFLIILSVLVVVHELGHFSVAKFFGIRVDEFGLGYPPKAKKLFRWKGTDFTLNWLPFGGFVKIFGENPEEESGPTLNSDSFQYKNRGIQGAVLVAGVVGNFFFAWLLISIGFSTGLPAPAGLDLPIRDAETVITMVVPGSPAALSGVRSGDALLSLSRGGVSIPDAGGGVLTPEQAAEFISRSLEPVTFTIKRKETVTEEVVTPATGIIPDRPAAGISMDMVGIVELPVGQAIYQGFKTTAELTVETGRALGTFISQAVTGRADLSSVTGPVGLVGMVGNVRDLGLGYLLTFTALISINLCLINLLPFPALDGGRLLFVGIETITRRAIPAKLFNAVNAAGFALLIFLMVLITIHDVRNIL